MNTTGQFLFDSRGTLINIGDHSKFAMRCKLVESEEDDYELALYDAGFVRVRMHSDGHLAIAGNVDGVKRVLREVLSPKVKYVTSDFRVTKEKWIRKRWQRVEDFETHIMKF